MAALENLFVGACLRKKETKENLEEFWNPLPIPNERKNHIAGSLSASEQQKLAIGRARMRRSNTVVLDEPSLGLAPIVVQKLANFIFRVKQSRLTF